jgi:hypothetical protein
METNHPAHKYEDNPDFLMDAQNEIRRVLCYAYKNMNIQFITIENSNDNSVKLEEKLKVLKAL